MSEPFTEIGIGGAIAVIILREVFGFIKQSKKNGQYVPREECNLIKAFNEQKFENAEKDRYVINNKIDKLFDKVDEVKTLIKNGSK
jgi:hypothetical protein